MNYPNVVITKCNDYVNEEVYQAIKASVDLLGGIEAFVKKGERILLKPNLLSAKPPEAAITTHPAVVRAVLQLVRECGGGGVDAADPFPLLDGAAGWKDDVLQVADEFEIE